MKSLVLCADDFGLSVDINEGILQLLELQRLSAVSCMTCLPDWHASAKALLPYQQHAAIGLHFNLTESARAVPLGKLMLQALTGRIDRGWIKAELTRQLDDFESTFGAAPDFIDGHQHVHIFSGVREVLAEVLAQRFPVQRPWVRQVNPSLQGHDAHFKALVLRMMGRGFSIQMQHQAISLTRSFAGLYSLDSEADFPRLLQGWIERMPSGGLIMCHPGAMAGNADTMAQTRQREMHYLSSDQFMQWLQDQSVNLTSKPTLV